MHLSILSPTTPSQARVEEWWGTKSSQIPTLESSSRILWTVKSPTSGMIFQVKSDQIPHYFPRYAGREVVANSELECHSTSRFIAESPVVEL